MSCLARRSYFISDLHLSLQSPALLSLFEFFIQHIAPSAQALYILGDFLSLYLGSKNDTVLLEAIQQRLSPLFQSDIPVYFMPGNRDFLCTALVIEAYGFRYLPDPSPLLLYDEQERCYPVLLMHGDALSTTPPIYPLYRALVRSSVFERIFLSIPVWLREKIARRFQRDYRPSAIHQTEELDSRRIEAQQRPYAWMIHGHVHQAKIEVKEGVGTRCVLSDWSANKATCFIWNPLQARLELHEISRSGLQMVHAVDC